MRRAYSSLLTALPLIGALLAAPTHAEAQAAQPVIHIGYIPVLGAAPAYIISQEGWDKQAGFELKLTQFDSGPNMILGLASGTLEAYMGGIGPLMVAGSQGIAVKVVASTAVEELVVAGGPELSAEAAKGGTKAEAISRLAAKLGRPVKIATQPVGSIPDTVLKYWLQEDEHVDPAKVQIVAMGIDATQQALLAGAVDAATVREPALTIIQDRQPAVKVLAYGKDMIKDQPGTVLGVTAALAKEHPEQVQKLVELVDRAVTLIAQDPARAAADVEKVLGRGIVDVKTMQRALTSPASQFVVDPRRIVEKTKTLQDFQVKTGVLKKAEPLDTLFDASYYEKLHK
ncbi:ABC transporter substrate-binding protein [Nitrospirillum sp. BR 11828]|uniref:ABC transporter substrate-binding protein n=1 Tax=Nitrospirillum sp. BR 11828 TaxID=3104325 RepID=UPI002ACA8D8A|nr:ABC transporter substrate-binding protein [Nitrospirillum sp. BR 11828]MDZ5649372.1 ABC transporter substrate-binding protein [Nitrospirillum sp. BR 11828]